MKDIRPTVQFSLNQGAFWASYSVILAYAGVFLLAHDFSNSQIGVVVAVGSALSVFMQPKLGAYADSCKKCILQKLIVIISLVVIALAGVILAAGKVFWLIAILYGLLAALHQLLTPLTYSLGMFFISKGVNINFGIARGFGSLCYAITATVLGKLVDKYSTNVVMYAAIIFYILLIITTVTFHFKGVDENNIIIDNNSPKSVSDIAFLKSHKNFAMVLFGAVLMFIAHNIISNYAFQIVSAVGGGSSEMGVVLALSAVVEIPILFNYNFINKKIDCAKLLRIASVCMGLRSLMMFLSPNIPMLYFSQLFQMPGYGLYCGASVYYTDKVIEPEHRVRGQAFMTLTCAAGSVLGSFLGGWIIDLVNVKGMLLVGTVIAFMGSALVIIFSGKGSGTPKTK